jgi:outer membrane protein assembly factor BamA
MIGGVEGALRPPLGNSLSVPEGNFTYLTQAAQMRGFYNNIRNGNSFFLVNTEIRIPLVQYIFPNIRAAWLKNLQGIGFFDCGSAWQSGKLFSTDNPLNIVTLPENNPNSPVTIKVNYFRDPIIMGTGYGLRTTFFGYFVKFDYAWGVETRVFQKPIKHFSIGLDF